MDIDKLRLLLGSSLDNIEQMKLDFSEFSDKIKITEKQYTFDVMDNPFFIQPKTVIINNIVNPNLDLYITLFNSLDTPIKFNHWIMMTYILSGHPDIGITIGEWTLYSFHQTVDYIKKLKEENSKITWTNLGHRYMGLGHIEVLRMDIENGDLFIQPDGGSNGYERLDYWEKYKNQKINKEETIEFKKFVLST